MTHHSLASKLRTLWRQRRVHTGRVLRPGDRYRVRGRARIVPRLGVHGSPRTYLLEPRILDTLVELVGYADRLLREHGIGYVVCYGTLLGAARHAGQIPWDDDADLFILEHRDMARIGALGARVAADGYRLVPVNDYYKLARADDPLAYPYLDFFELWDQLRPEHLHPLRRVPFEDFEVNVPQRMEESLVETFGRDPSPLDTIVHDRLTSHRASMLLIQLLRERAYNVVGDAAAWVRDTLRLEKCNP